MGAEPNIRRIELVCPQCDHHQMEPSMVISTQCRACGQHMDILDGKPVIKAKFATRLASGSKPPIEHPAVGPVVINKPGQTGRAVGFLRKFFKHEPEKRSVDCYHCHRPMDVIREAQSSQCPKCGGYISLKDYEIDRAWRRRIQTRGDVVILKSGSIIGVNVQCHHLTVLGQLAASVDCSGDLTIRSHGKIVGNVKCRELRIERGAIVEFQGDIDAQRSYIDGQVKAKLTCVGTITLEKNAHLQGLARAGALVVKPGGKHTGIMEVVQPAGSQAAAWEK
ncbi:MAG: polymer-forming cytoskeletal protein [Armatimonadetes bacterium]|nr:polymer-forming cytoskeletal protein [Akkermansiaceae bacterium]